MSHDSFPTDAPAVVTAGLPYANGDLHIGHLRSIIAADVYARGLRRLGQTAPYVCGSDIHGTPIAVTADQEGVDPETLALEYHDQYQRTFDRYNVEFAEYGHTGESTNIDLTQSIVATLADEGHIVEKAIEVAWDPIEDTPLPDRYVEGTCPYCGATARGDECDEGCGRHLEPGEIEDPISTITGNPAEYRTRRHKFFRLRDYQSYLQGFLDRLEGTDNARNQPREWVDGTLEDWCITRDLDWGVEYPGDPPEGQDKLVLYVWVDAPTGYISFTKQYSDRVGTESYDWEAVWRPDTVDTDDIPKGGGEIVHFIGADIIQHHTVFWPAMLRASGYMEPRAVAACGYVTLRGDGFSTSRNRAVWAQEYLDAGFDPAPLRHYLAVENNFQQDLDFSWERFQERVNADLVSTVGNFLYRSLLFAHRNYGGTPDTECSESVLDRIETASDEFTAAVNDYDVRALAQVPVDLARFGNQYIQRHEPWRLVDDDPESAAQVIRDCVQLAKAVAIFSHPVTPGKATALWNQLDEPTPLTDVAIDATLEAPPDVFEEPSELYDHVDDDVVEDLATRLDDRVEPASDTSEQTGEDVDFEPIESDRISFESFQNLDLRVGRITAADPVADADDLVRLDVDIGLETRQVVAGIKQLHDVETLPGTKVILVANLEPTELFGIESDGMLLAAGEEADLLTTHGDSEPGTRIH